MEIWIEFDGGKWRISPDPAKISRGSLLWWRFRGEGINARRLRWTIYFPKGHPFAFGGVGIPIIAEPLSMATETLRLPDGQHIGASPVVVPDSPGDYKYGVRLEDLDEERELGDEDPHLIVF